MDDDILNTVHSIFGKNVEIVDCEKTSSVQEEELIFVNGIPVKLETMTGDRNALKTALLEGKVPSVDILNQLLQKAGLVQQSIQLETSLSIKSTLTTTEDVQISRYGRILEQQKSETKEDFTHHSKSKDILQPILQENLANLQQEQYSGTKINESFESLGSNAKQSKKNCFTSNSTIVDSPNDISSEISNYSTHTFSSTTDSPASSSSLIKNLNNPLSTNIGTFRDYRNENKSNQSYDSGHGGEFLSLSHSIVWPQLNREPLENSFASCITIKSDDNSSIKTQDGYNSFCSSYNNKEEATPKITANYEKYMCEKNEKSRAATMPSSNSDSSTLIYDGGKLSSGCLETLLEHIIPRNNYYPDADFVYAFLLCSRMFIKPSELLAQIVKIWKSQNQFEPLTKSINYLKQLLEDWIKYFPSDFRDDVFKQELRILCMKYKTLDDSLNAQLTKNHIKIDKNDKTMTLPKPQILANACENPVDIAHQLTIIELAYLSSIELEEFLQIFEKDFQNYLRYATPSKTVLPSNISFTIGTNESNINLSAYIKWYNRLSILTATEILKFPKKKERARIIEYWIETAKECFNIGNFNSVMGILTGLNLYPISRLKKTWLKVNSAKFIALEHQMDPTSNFDSYRSTMKAAIWRSECATQQHGRIIIPFFILLLRDLYQLSDNIRSKLPNNHINYETCSIFAEQIKDFNRWKTFSCPYERIPQIVDLLKYGLVFDEQTLMGSSFRYEPPGNPQEKELFKQFKTKKNL